MTSIKNTLKRTKQLVSQHKRLAALVIVIFLAVTGFLVFRSGSSDSAQAFSVVQTVGRGSVSSGIETTGKIVAAQKLDLDVYKQLSRIDVVNIKNGSHVEKGSVLVSFDKSDANVNVRSAAVSVTEAELKLQTAQTNASDPNTEIFTLENQIKGYKKSLGDAYLDFLNANLEVKARKGTREETKTPPTLSDRYIKGENEYKIQIDFPDFNDIYHTESLLLYKVFDNTGKLSEHELIYDTPTPLADTGLRILFTTTMNPEVGDEWHIKVPNTNVGSYAETKADYEETVRNLEVNLASAEQKLADLKQTDTGDYRDLNLEQAELAFAEARQRLSENYDVVKERDIVAPFAGSVQDMQNVVVGATPTGGSEDSIRLGTLISDEYLITFALDAADVAKVKVGQKVQVSVTSYANQPTFDATITEISSLPTESGVAQYDVNALLDYDARTAQTVLREGMLADVVVVQEEKENVLRVPTSAIAYEEGQPVVKVVGSLTDEQRQQVEQLGIVRTTEAELATYPVTVKLGVAGRFYTEIVSGLEEGTLIVTTATALQSETGSAVQQGFGPPNGHNFQGGNSPRAR